MADQLFHYFGTTLAYVAGRSLTVSGEVLASDRIDALKKVLSIYKNLNETTIRNAKKVLGVHKDPKKITIRDADLLGLYCVVVEDPLELPTDQSPVRYVSAQAATDLALLAKKTEFEKYSSGLLVHVTPDYVSANARIERFTEGKWVPILRENMKGELIPLEERVQV